MVTALIILAVIAIVCAVGWFFRYITSCTLMWYLQEREIPFPSKEELKKGNDFVIRHIFKLLKPR